VHGESDMWWAIQGVFWGVRRRDSGVRGSELEMSLALVCGLPTSRTRGGTCTRQDWGCGKDAEADFTS
jgi:hypothetical protein